MDITEWKYIRNRKVEKLKTRNCSLEEIGKELAIDQKLIRAILDGDYDWQTKFWQDKRKERPEKEQSILMPKRKVESKKE